MKFEFLGPYRVEKILGQGGMGNVFLGTHSNTGESVAIKVIASALADQERFRRRFAAEVETLKRLKHVNIVQLIGYGEEDGHLFYSMEYVSGQSLAEKIKKTGRIPWDRTLEIAIEVCSALKHAHDFGIIHRDLKPANVMLTETGQVKLTDFGIAKLFGSADVTAAGSVLGTADYMPPEQAEGKPVTARSDLYALGSLIFAMISGRSPHAAKTMPEVLYNVRHSIPLALDKVVSDTPIELSELVAQLLAKEIADRPPTALVVSNRLQSLQLGLRSRQNETAISELDEVERSSKADAIDEVADAPTQAASYSGSIVSEQKEEPPSRGVTHFEEVDEQDRQRTSFSDGRNDHTTQPSTWISIVLLSLMILASVGSIFYFTRSPSADQLYARISKAVESNDEDALIAIEPEIDNFENLYPNDPRMKELNSIKKSIEEQRIVRGLLRRSRMIGSESELDALEQAFLECYRLQQHDTELAKKKFRAFLTIFDRQSRLTPRQRTLVDAAQEILQKLEFESRADDPLALAHLIVEIEWAKKNLDDKSRKHFYRAIIELYADKPWSAKAIQPLREHLK